MLYCEYGSTYRLFYFNQNLYNFTFITLTGKSTFTLFKKKNMWIIPSKLIVCKGEAFDQQWDIQKG